MSANAGEISVELRLQLSKLQGDVNRAAGMMRKGLAVNLGGGGGGGGGSGSGSGGSSGSGPPPVGGGSGGGSGGPPPIPKGGGGFQMYGGGHASLGRAVLGGLMGGAAAGAIIQSIRLLERIIDRFSKVFEDSAKLYVNALRTGGGTGFATQRSNIAQVMGVSSEEVYRFGAAMQYVNEMTATATQSLVQTMPELTATTWKFRATMLSLEAAFAQLVTALTPVINWILDKARALADFANKNADITKAAGRSALIGSMPGGDLISMILGSVSVAQLVKNGGFTGNVLGPTKGEQAPAPSASPDRLPASAWEKMGLIVGNSANTNYAQKTAENTRRLVQLWEQFVGGQAVYDMPQGGFQGGPGVSRSGTPILSPVTNSP